jgi:3-phosphoshikimate 1-carboxyvinyltransferase
MLAALGNGTCMLTGVLFSDDSRAFLSCLVELGFCVEIREDLKQVTIDGTGGKIPNKSATINVKSAGTAARFLTVMLAVAGGDYVLESSEQMKKRPMEPLILALRDAGVTVTCLEEEYHFPFEIHSDGFHKEEVAINTDVSSQFASALLMAGILKPEGLTVLLEGGRTNGSYLKVTLKVMEQFGIQVQREGDICKVPCNLNYHIEQYDIEPDLSAAAYFYAIAPLCGKSVTVFGVQLDSMQGDIKFVSVLEQLGCELIDTKEGLMVKKADHEYAGIEINMKDFSDQTMTMAVVAAFATSPTKITNVGHIRFQESNRIEAIVTELNRMGIQASATEEEIFIIPGVPQSAAIETYEDHRMAMAFALIGLRAEGIEILNPACCAKTFENFFDVLDELCEN